MMLERVAGRRHVGRIELERLRPRNRYDEPSNDLGLS
jgi:hypothetical protein